MCLSTTDWRAVQCNAKGHQCYSWKNPRCFIDRNELRRKAWWNRVKRGEAGIFIGERCFRCGEHVDGQKRRNDWGKALAAVRLLPQYEMRTNGDGPDVPLEPLCKFERDSE